MSLPADLEEYVHSHRLHGTLTGDATGACLERLPAHCGCPCGVKFERWVTPEEADADLRRLARLN